MKMVYLQIDVKNVALLRDGVAKFMLHGVKIKKELIGWGVLCAGLIFLYLLSSTNWIIKEKEVEVYPVSVIISDTSDDNYVNFRKGIDQAAGEFNADVSFITLYDKDNMAQQMELVRREAADGTGAVILEPVDARECRAYLEENTYGTPLVVLSELMADDEVKGAVYVDWMEAGRKMGEAIASRHKSDIPVWIFANNPMLGIACDMKNGLIEVLKERGFSYTVVSRATDDTYRSVIENTVYPGSGNAVIAALDASGTAEAADIISGSNVYGKYISGLYGVGTTPSLLYQLDNGTIQGLIVTNQFDAGYFLIKKAVQAIKKDQERDQITLESYYIEKNDLRSKQYEKMLYPID